MAGTVETGLVGDDLVSLIVVAVLIVAACREESQYRAGRQATDQSQERPGLMCCRSGATRPQWSWQELGDNS